MKDQDQRLIEDYIPVRQISYEATREKVTRRRDRHITMLHLWWARRPLAAARAAVYAALVPALKPDADRTTLNGFFERLCHWGESIDVADARDNIAEAFNGRAPKVLDPFAGGGAIPLEAIRLGCDTYGVELNPVAYLINLCTNVYPQQFGVELKDLVALWGKKVIDAVKADVGDLYPSVPDPKGKPNTKKDQLEFAGTPAASTHKKNLTPVAFLWTRTVPCPESPNRPAHLVPLVRQTWLVRKKDRFVALKMVPDRKAMRIRFDLVEAESEAGLGFDPADFSSRGEATCPLCGNAVSAAYIKEQGKLGRMGHQPMAVVCFDKGIRGKRYFALNEAVDDATINARLEALAAEGMHAPSEPLAVADNQHFQAPLYGMAEFRRLFTPRQLLTLLTFAKHVRLAHDEMLSAGADRELARAVATYLAMLVDRIAERSTVLCRWNSLGEKTETIYARQAIPMVWDFSETNPFGSSSGSAVENLKQISLVIEHCANTGRKASIVRGSATKLPLEDCSFDAVVTDPPYYDNISYSDLSDFFYVWLKRSVGHLYPEHFAGELTPKKSEIIASNYRHESKEAARAAYEGMMEEALRECRRVLKPGCPLVAVYAHKTTAGWATLVKALRRAKFVVTEAWPLDTEKPDRAGQMNTAHLATSIFIVARRRDSEETGDYLRQVRPQLQAVLAERVRTLFKVGVSGSDLIIASLGAGLRAYTQYARVELPNGDELSEEAFLDETQREVLEIVLEQVLHCDRHGVGAVDKPTQFYVLGRFEYGDETVDFGEVNMLAKGVGVEVDGSRGMQPDSPPLVKVAKSDVTLLDYSNRGADEELGVRANGVSAPLIDVLHRLLWLSENEPGKVREFLDAAQPDSDKLRLVAQALAGRTISDRSVDRTAEQKALDRALASWRSVVEQTLFTRGRA